MAGVRYKYEFGRQVVFIDVLAVLGLALVAIESVHGDSRVRLDARFADDADWPRCGARAGVLHTVQCG